jgi:hypothetical protein
MNQNQPPRLHQNEPLVCVLPLPKADNFSLAMALNLWGCLAMVSFGLLGHSLPQFLSGLVFAGAWVYGVLTPDAVQYRFYLATALVTVVAVCSLGFHAIA